MKGQDSMSRKIQVFDKDTNEQLGVYPSQADAAAELGVHYSTVSRWIREPHRCRKYRIVVLKNFKHKE